MDFYFLKISWKTDVIIIECLGTILSISANVDKHTPLNFSLAKMTTRQGTKSQKSSSRVANSPTSSTTSSSKQFPENSIDGVSSPASSSARSKPQYYYTENLPLNAERSKENVTVTVRFRPLRYSYNF